MVTYSQGKLNITVSGVVVELNADVVDEIKALICVTNPPVVVTPPNPTVPPFGSPLNFNLEKTGQINIRASWEAVQNAVKYEITLKYS